MPFTPAHVAAVLPFLGEGRVRSRLDSTALVLGSMAPDFDYFLHGRMQGSIAHTGIGLFLFDLPVTLVLWCAWRFVCAQPVRVSLPSSIHRRLGSASTEPPAILAIVLGALVGSATHLLWDGFTHATGPFVRGMPSLHADVALPVLGGLPIYRGLQHASTVGGLMVLAGWGLVRLARTEPAPLASDVRAVRFLLPLACAVGGAVGLAWGIGAHGIALRTLAHVVVLTIDGWLIGLMIGSLLLRAVGFARS